MKYKVKVDSFATKFISRNVTVFAKNDEEAVQKAIDKYDQIVRKNTDYVDVGTVAGAEILND